VAAGAGPPGVETSDGASPGRGTGRLPGSAGGVARAADDEGDDSPDPARAGAAPTGGAWPMTANAAIAVTTAQCAARLVKIGR
jgi:hypothetical protein